MIPAIVAGSVAALVYGNAATAVAGANGRIAFASNRGGGGHTDIYIVNGDGSGVLRLTDTALLDETNPAISPDGSRIAYLLRTQIQIVGADGGQPTQLDTGSVGVGGAPAWSPDGTKLVFEGVGPAPGGYTTGRKLWIVDASGGTPRRLTANLPGRTFADDSPSWSPDGTRIVFHSNSSDTGRDEIFTIASNATVTKPDGGDARVQLTQTATDSGSPARNDQNPRWSPDGRRIVFERGTGTNVGDTTKELWAINVDAGGSPGGAPQQLTTNSYYDGHPSWSPDGTRIAFQSNRNGHLQIFTMPATAGGAAAVLMDTGSSIDDSDPDWGGVSGPSRVEPDLTVTRVTASPGRAVGSPISLSWTVKNVGTAATPETWHDSVYLSATPQSPRTLLMSLAEPSRRGLPAGASYSVTRSVSIPDGLAAGRNYLTVVTDSDHAIRESSYGNNVFSVPVDINASPLVGLPSPLDLGSVMVGEVNEPKTLTLRSVFSGRVEVGRVSAEPGGGKSGQGGRGGPRFEPIISRDHCTGERLGRGGKCRMELTVKIADRKFAGAFKVRILISSKDASGRRLPDSPVMITGEAVPGPLVGSPSPLDLGSVMVGQVSAGKTLTVRNLLARHVEVGRVSAEEGRGVRTAFQPIITHDQCTGERLPAGGRCQMDVAIKITGRRLGRFTVRILISSSDASGRRHPDSLITITGVATRP